MGDGPRGIKVFQDHFQASTSGAETSQTGASNLHTKIEFEHHSSSHLWTTRRLRSVTSMLNLFNLKRLPWGTDTNGKQKLVLSATEVESLRSELADLEEREAQLKAQLEHIDETLRAARLSGYLQMRTYRDGQHYLENQLLLTIQKLMTGFHALLFSKDHAYFCISSQRI